MKFIVYAPSYYEDSGGSIVLHKLCDQLNRLGIDSKIYPFDFSKIHSNKKEIAKALLMKILQITFKSRFKTNKEFKTPVSRSFDRENTIVIYPEIEKNNPLNAKYVVRWLLYKNEWFSRHPGIYQRDLFFFYQSAFQLETENLPCGGELRITHLQTNTYYNLGNKNRKNICHAIRKGKLPKGGPPKNSILIDNLSHHEVAAIFNKSYKFISYDAYTMYSQYAALCGCLSVVNPIENVSKEEWQPIEELRYGVAYGEDDTNWAKSTQDKVLSYLKSKEEDNSKNAKNLVEKCRIFFNMQ